MYIIIDWIRRFVIVGETLQTLHDRAATYRDTMRKVLFSQSGSMVSIGRMVDDNKRNKDEVRLLEKRSFEWWMTRTSYRVFNYVRGGTSSVEVSFF